MSAFERERVDTVVIGGGQTGLSVGYHLSRRGVPFVILDANPRIGDAWRNRWDSLQLFTPAHLDGLDGLPFPAPATHFPTKDEMADYLTAYADRFDLPVRLGMEVDHLCRKGDRFVVAAADSLIEADNVVVAMAGWQENVVPMFASDLSPSITQVRSADYRRPSQLPAGDVLVVGAANSGAEIALDMAGDRKVYLAGNHPGHVPFDVDGFFGRHIGTRLVGFVFHHILTRETRVGRKMIAHHFGKGMPLVRTKPRDLQSAGIETVGRVEGVLDGLPLTEDGRALDVEAIVWACGYHPKFSWIDEELLDGTHPRHPDDPVREVPGLYFAGLPYLYAVSSHTIHGVGRDAARIADAVAARARTGLAAEPTPA